MRRWVIVAVGLVCALVAAVIVINRDDGKDEPSAGIPTASVDPDVKLPQLDLSRANRRAPLPGLPDWSKAGYRGGEPLPTDAEVNADENCRITAAELDERYGVKADDGDDDSDGLQQAVDAIRQGCSGTASYTKLSLITLPSGQLDVSRQLGIDADYLIVRGAGNGPDGTRFVFRPDENTRYDALTEDGSDWDEDGMEYEGGNGGWMWPGRGLFRVQSRQVDEDYKKAYGDAPANRKDLFEGTVNAHWKAGVKLREKPGDPGFAARTGDTVVYLDKKADRFTAGGFVNVRAANTLKFYEQQHALGTEGGQPQNLHMRQQLFEVKAVDEQAETITLDRPLEYDVPVDSVSDGSEEIDGKVYDSKASPLVDPVLGVGLEGFSITQPVAADQARTKNDYGNVAPAEEMHGIVLKWAVNSWVRGIRTTMTGSHPIVTEEAKNLQIQDNYLDGAWNKGKGGNGYLRGSRVWDSVYARNVLRNLRHLTLQWSSSGNVVIGNDLDADLNLHGGWERRNLFELNRVRVSAEHRSGSCSSNCGGEGGDAKDDSTWYPIWWGAGQKAVKWSGATGPQNVFFGNELSKQTSQGGDYKEYLPDRRRIYQFGWDGSAYKHLSKDGAPIADWAGNELTDFTGGNGVDASRTDPGPSLFLKRAG